MSSGLVVNEDNTDEVLEALSKGILNALEAVGETAEGYAKLACPVDTGRLRNSITHEVSGGEKAVYIGTNVEYAEYVERGTSRQAAQPYLVPAAQGHTSVYRAIFQGYVKGGA